MNHVSVCVLASDARPCMGAHVRLEIYQFLTGRRTQNRVTDGEGRAEFALDIHSGAEIAVYVNHRLHLARGPMQDTYQMRLSQPPQYKVLSDH